MPRRELFSEAQCIEPLALPIDDGEFIRHYTLSMQDLAVIRQRRGDHNRLGFAVQLCYLRYPGRELWPGAKLDPRILRFTAQQLGVNDEVWIKYAQRDETRREHIVSIIEIFGFQSFGTSHYRTLVEWLLPLAMQTDQGMVPGRAVLEELRSHRIIVSPITVIEQLCVETLSRALRKIYRHLTTPQTKGLRLNLDGLPGPHESKQSAQVMTWIRQPSGTSDAKHVLGLIERLKLIRDLGLPAGLEQSLLPNQHPHHLCLYGDCYCSGC